MHIALQLGYFLLQYCTFISSHFNSWLFSTCIAPSSGQIFNKLFHIGDTEDSGVLGAFQHRAKLHKGHKGDFLQFKKNNWGGRKGLDPMWHSPHKTHRYCRAIRPPPIPFHVLQGTGKKEKSWADFSKQLYTNRSL